MDSLEALEKLDSLELQAIQEGKDLPETKDHLEAPDRQVHLDQMERREEMADMELATIAHLQELRQDIKQKNILEIPCFAQLKEKKKEFFKNCIYIIILIIFSFKMCQKAVG